MDLLDAVVDREADLLERIGLEVDQVSHDIFDPQGNGPVRTMSYQAMLKTIGSSRFAVYHHVVRRRAEAMLEARFPDEFSRQLDARRSVSQRESLSI